MRDGPCGGTSSCHLLHVRIQKGSSAGAMEGLGSMRGQRWHGLGAQGARESRCPIAADTWPTCVMLLWVSSGTGSLRQSGPSWPPGGAVAVAGVQAEGCDILPVCVDHWIQVYSFTSNY